MTLTEQLRAAIRAGSLPPIFCSADLKDAAISDLNNNLSNYDKKNAGIQNKHQTVLVSRLIEGVTYYAFDDKLFS